MKGLKKGKRCGRFRFLSRESTRYGVSHENTFASGPRCGSAYHERYDAVWNSAFVGPLNLDQGTKSI